MSQEYPLLSIHGWMSDQERDWLYETAKQMSSIVEIGSYQGKSTHALLSGCKSGIVTAVDHWEGQEGQFKVDGGEAVYQAFLENCGKFPNLVIEKMSSKEAAEKFLKEGKKFDMVFLDAGHNYEDVKEDLALWHDLGIKLLCGHDYDEAPVKKAVDEFLNITGLCGSIWYYKLDN